MRTGSRTRTVLDFALSGGLRVCCFWLTCLCSSISRPTITRKHVILALLDASAHLRRVLLGRLASSRALGEGVALPLRAQRAAVYDSRKAALGALQATG